MKTLKLNRDLSLIAGSIGAIQSLLFSLYLLVVNKRIFHKSLLALLFLSLTIRVTKSFLWINYGTVSDLVLNIGFIAHSAIAPLFWLYIKYFLTKNKCKSADLLHFIPTIALISVISFIDEDNFWQPWGYLALLIHQIVYTFASLFNFLRLARVQTLVEYLKSTKYLWVAILSSGLIGIQLIYFSNYVSGILHYEVGSIAYAISIFIIILFWLVHSDKLLKGRHKYQSIKIEKDIAEICKTKIEDYLDQEKPYLDNSFNLGKLSEATSIQPYVVSYIINNEYGTNFSKFVNSYRIKEAQKKLLKEGYKNIKISVIAYECGFNSLSAFNIAFKKIANCTPTQFRSKALSEL